MKTIVKKIALLGLLIVSAGSKIHAQNTNEKSSLLWEVSGKGLTKPSYLFGTIHMICEKDFVMKPKVVNAFSKTDKLALEINLADPNEITTMQQMAMGKEPLSKKLTKSQLDKLESILKSQAGMSVSQVDNFTMQTILSLLAIKSFGCNNLKFYEMEFVAKAKEKQIPIMGFEKVAEQMDYLSKSFSDDEMINYLEKNDSEMTTKMVSIYLKEDIKTLYEFTTNKEFMSEESSKWMLIYRNNNWIKKMPEMMQKESVFFAVGAAHLGGENGVINLLRNAGYTVKPIVE
jgi:uncharacterized protein